MGLPSEGRQTVTGQQRARNPKPFPMYVLYALTVNIAQQEVISIGFHVRNMYLKQKTKRKKTKIIFSITSEGY